jgi:hypothetical protein
MRASSRELVDARLQHCNNYTNTLVCTLVLAGGVQASSRGVVCPPSVAPAVQADAHGCRHGQILPGGLGQINSEI